MSGTCHRHLCLTAGCCNVWHLWWVSGWRSWISGCLLSQCSVYCFCSTVVSLTPAATWTPAQSYLRIASLSTSHGAQLARAALLDSQNQGGVQQQCQAVPLCVQSLACPHSAVQMLCALSPKDWTHWREACLRVVRQCSRRQGTAHTPHADCACHLG